MSEALGTGLGEPIGAGLEEPANRNGAFPRLRDGQRARLRAAGRARNVQSGDVLFREGDAGYDFFLVESGAVAIVQGYGPRTASSPFTARTGSSASSTC